MSAIPRRAAFGQDLDFWPLPPEASWLTSPRLYFLLDLLKGSECVRVDPPGCAPGVTHLVTQAFRCPRVGGLSPKGFQLGPSTGGQRLRSFLA